MEICVIINTLFLLEATVLRPFALFVAAILVFPSVSWADRFFTDFEIYEVVQKVFSGTCKDQCRTEVLDVQRIPRLTYFVPPEYSQSTQVDFYKISSKEDLCGSAGCAWALVAISTNRSWYSASGSGVFVSEYLGEITLAPASEVFLPSYLGTRPKVYGESHIPELMQNEPQAGASLSAEHQVLDFIQNKMPNQMAHISLDRHFGLGQDGSDKQLSGNTAWNIQNRFWLAGLSSLRIEQAEENRTYDEDIAQKEAECSRTSGLCMVMKRHGFWRMGWTAEFTSGSRFNQYVSQEDGHKARYQLGGISDLRVIDVSQAQTHNCDFRVTMRIWIDEPTPFGQALIEYLGSEALVQENCFSLGRYDVQWKTSIIRL